MEGGGGVQGMRFAAAPRTLGGGGTTMPRPIPLVLMAILLLLAPRARASNSNEEAKGCTFPKEWSGRWFLNGIPGAVIVNSTHLLDRKCQESKDNDTFLTVEENYDSPPCFRCMIVNMKTENVIQYRESEFCTSMDLSFACAQLTSDQPLNSLFRLDSKPIPCPFDSPPFSFSYNKNRGECKALENQVETCTDNSKLLLKYQACADVPGTESGTEELQCLATWKDGRNHYLVGTLKSSGEDHFRCFLYERIHHNGQVGYLMSQNSEPTCNGLTSVSEGGRTFNFTKEKEHARCKYPTWVTQHHDWHFLDGSRNYHFMTGNSTLKVVINDQDGASREEKVVCHNLEKMQSNDDMQGPKVKLVAHVTSGCDTGYVCMIFHKRDGHVIEVQQSSQKSIMPHEACAFDDPSTKPFFTLRTSTLHKRSCPQPGRYMVLDVAPPTPQLKLARRHRRFPSTWKEFTVNEGLATPDDECQNADVQIGCYDRNEMMIQESCKTNDIVSAYSCHASWEEGGTYFTIVSRNKTTTEKETLCVSTRTVSSIKELPNKMGSIETQELWMSRPQSSCQRGPTKQWTYKLTNQGVCEDLTRAASASSSSLTRVSIGLTIVATLLCTLLSR